MTDKTREDFEAWAKANDLDPLWKDKNGKYVYWESEWLAYQAATQQSAARIAALQSAMVAIKSLLSRDPCAHAHTAIQMIDAAIEATKGTP